MIQKLVAKWDEFFFKPTSPATIGLFRIVFGLVVFLSMLGKFPYRELFYSDRGIVSYATMTHYFPGNPWIYFRWMPDTDPGLMIYFFAMMIATVSLIFGFCTRASSILVFLGLISLNNRNLFVDNQGDDLMRINALILIFTEAGAAYSIDRWLRKRKGKEGDKLPLKSPWAQRLLQLQLAYLYFDTAYLKLPGEAWRNGTALYYALHYLEFQRFRFPFLFYYLWQIKIATWLALVIEFAAAILVWFRRFRYPVLIAAFFLHLGINLMMQFPVFQYVMMASLINFIYPYDVERIIESFKLRIVPQ
jgi:hypothetical protein